MQISAPAPIVKAYSRLTGLRGNIPASDYTTRDLSDEFNQAIRELKSAGYDVMEFSITDTSLEEMWGGGLEVRTALLKTRIDAVLTCFRIDHGEEKVGIGFLPPKGGR
jgi:hypothetical protein